MQVNVDPKIVNQLVQRWESATKLNVFITTPFAHASLYYRLTPLLINALMTVKSINKVLIKCTNKGVN